MPEPRARRTGRGEKRRGPGRRGPLGARRAEAGPGSISTETTMASVNTSYPSTCEPDPSYCAGEDVFSVEVEANSTGSIVTPASGDVQFVFDAPVVDTNGGVDPYEFTQFTLVTTENGQTACPISWQNGSPGSLDIWQTDPISQATGGIPACTMTD